jgi:hypothetical protein
MTHERAIERLLDRWLGDGPSEAPDRILATIADRIERQPQRPAWRLDWRSTFMNRTIAAVAALAAVIVIAVVGFGLLGGGSRSSIGGPPPSPTPSPIASPAAPSASAAVIPKACDLATPAEVAAALNLSSPVTSGPASGSNADVDYCIYSAAGAEVLDVTYRNNGGGPVFDVWNRGTGVQAVPGLGDKAIWDPAQATLFILKGSRLLEIAGVGGSPPFGLEAAKAIGSIAAVRM